jgi:hypothetical protein
METCEETQINANQLPRPLNELFTYTDGVESWLTRVPKR